jgi:hypothetical protein
MMAVERAIDALQHISPDLDRDTWVKVCMAAHAAEIEFDVVDRWSAGADSYNARAMLDTWRSLKPGKGVGAGTLFKMAAENGWRMGGERPTSRPAPAPRKAAAPAPKPAPGMSPSEVWARCQTACAAHPYIVAKGAAGVPLDGLRVVPADDKLHILREPMAGALVQPCYGPDGELQSLQFVTTGEVAARLGKGRKPNLPGSPMAGASFVVGELLPGGTAYVCEGIGAAWACWQATGQASVVCFGAGNVGKVAAAMRERDAAAHLVLVADRGKEELVQGIAADVGGKFVWMPQGEVDNFDANDLAQRDGHDALALLLEGSQVPAPPLPLSVAFADELPDEFTPPDELVEGLLTAGDGSVLYGDSNSGKTFMVIDLACAVARGVEWMGRKTEQGMVVYLAAESPQSVRSRLQAYQRHHGVRVPNFAIVQSPIDLFDGDADTDKVVDLVRQLEAQTGIKARLIVGDTLARLSAGANENAGQDMGQVVRRIDRIRTECAAHFLMIHHCGKAAANGARGWSGIRAAVDTEIEITDSAQGRCAEITKQRDLNTKGERIGFRLEQVTLGSTKWGAAATSCVVLPSDAPDKPRGKRMGEVEGAVVEFLAAHKVGIKKSQVVKHFDGRYEKGPIYRAMKTLVTAAAVHEAAGMVCIAGAAK